MMVFKILKGDFIVVETKGMKLIKVHRKSKGLG